ncbi:DUF4345 family protein [Pseudohongiella sp. SYSU M77423]|uniref:DUF4345 family protein n=1 Tax=Pseudohongiella sp. SYSU M77423 TaxID=3042312 RepID=UPI002480DCE2|nr:DUF4345 family protein [Pseudohongiella sp. SYSU M77423]MDH7943843.1 DUF4345 family protein [Pseudohongiella sp. SYSU M77423]MEC8861297.1 DUF4345 family protein [Pseudomonadota bacterium]
MLGKFILALSTMVFIAYGLVSLVNPAVPAGYAGLVMTNGNAYAEIGSMYGGLQTGVGLFCLLAIFRPEYYRGGLAVLVIGIGMLALARLISAVITNDALTLYTWGALAYETVTVVLAAMALWQSYRAVQA